MFSFALACSTPEAEQTTSTAIETPTTFVVLNAQVHTVDPETQVAEAFAYDDTGTIIAVGTESEVLELAGDNGTTLDAGGAMVVPGFQDAHVHVPEAGMNLRNCNFPPYLTVDEYGTLAESCAQQQAETGWVRASGASLFELRNSSESPLAALDRAIPDRPALVLDDLGHAAWTNSRGLEAAGISADTPDPPGGQILRDDLGNPTGLLLEDAQQLVRNAAKATPDAVYWGLLASIDELTANGVTTVSDAGGYWAQDHPSVWERALEERTLAVRAMNTLYVYSHLDSDEQLEELELRFSDDSDRLRFNTAKIYIDGILDLGTASLIEPYDVPLDDGYPSGFNYFTDEELTGYVDALHEAGFRINFHTIGDQAVRDALDAVEAINDSPEGIADRRHRTTHTYMVHPDDVDRFAEIGMVADFQQGPDALDHGYHDWLAEFIGDRAYSLIPTVDLVDSGATVVLSSDWDADPLSPLGTIQRALTRSPNPIPDLQTALEMHTIETAYALGHDDRTGSIEVGKYADYVVLDRDLFELAPEEIEQTQVLLTAVGGDIVYTNPSWSPTMTERSS